MVLLYSIQKSIKLLWNVICKRASVGKFLSEEKKERGHKNPSQSYVTVGGKLKKVQNTQIGSGSTDRSCRGFWVINSNRDRNYILYSNTLFPELIQIFSSISKPTLYVVVRKLRKRERELGLKTPLFC